MDKPLAGKVAIITGAGKGIGFAIAEILAEEKVTLMLNARTTSDLEQTKVALQRRYPNLSVEIFSGSVSDAATMEKMVETTKQRFGTIDILINNAGIAPRFVLLQELSLEELDNTIDINLKGPLYLMKYVIPHMVHQGGGTIININSIAGKVAYPYSSVYCASKFGLTGLTECISGEQRSNNIKIIGIHPGEVHTPLWDIIEPGIEQKPDLMLQAKDVAEAVRYALLQPENAYIKDVTLLPLRSQPH